MAAFGGPRTPAPAPPEKGVFPLDHFNECRPIMVKYMECLKENNNRGEYCREISKEYLQCRMDRNLMARQKLSELGFSEEEDKPSHAMDTASPNEAEKTKTGFLAGLPQQTGRENK